MEQTRVSSSIHHALGLFSHPTGLSRRLEFELVFVKLKVTADVRTMFFTHGRPYLLNQSVGLPATELGTPIRHKESVTVGKSCLRWKQSG